MALREAEGTVPDNTFTGGKYYIMVELFSTMGCCLFHY